MTAGTSSPPPGVSVSRWLLVLEAARVADEWVNRGLGQAKASRR